MMHSVWSQMNDNFPMTLAQCEQSTADGPCSPCIRPTTVRVRHEFTLHAAIVRAPSVRQCVLTRCACAMSPSTRPQETLVNQPNAWMTIRCEYVHLPHQMGTLHPKMIPINMARRFLMARVARLTSAVWSEPRKSGSHRTCAETVRRYHWLPQRTHQLSTGESCCRTAFCITVALFGCAMPFICIYPLGTWQTLGRPSIVEVSLHYFRANYNFRSRMELTFQLMRCNFARGERKFRKFAKYLIRNYDALSQRRSCGNVEIVKRFIMPSFVTRSGCVGARCSGNLWLLHLPNIAFAPQSLQSLQFFRSSFSFFRFSFLLFFAISTIFILHWRTISVERAAAAAAAAVVVNENESEFSLWSLWGGFMCFISSIHLFRCCHRWRSESAMAFWCVSCTRERNAKNKVANEKCSNTHFALVLRFGIGLQRIN